VAWRAAGARDEHWSPLPLVLLLLLLQIPGCDNRGRGATTRGTDSCTSTTNDINSTQLNRELRMQVSDTSRSASSLYTIINEQYHFMIFFSYRFPVPVSSAVNSNFTNRCCRNLSKRALNALTVQASTTELGKLFQIFTIRAEKNAFVSHNSANLWGEDVRIAFLNNKTRSPRRVNSALIFSEPWQCLLFSIYFVTFVVLFYFSISEFCVHVTRL